MHSLLHTAGFDAVPKVGAGAVGLALGHACGSACRRLRGPHLSAPPHPHLPLLQGPIPNNMQKMNRWVCARRGLQGTLVQISVQVAAGRLPGSASLRQPLLTVPLHPPPTRSTMHAACSSTESTSTG